jgi:hypothetical protein
MKNPLRPKIFSGVFVGALLFNSIAAAQTNSDAFTLEILHPNAVKPTQLIYEMKPGDTLTDEVKLGNEHPEKQLFWLYAEDQKLEEKNAFEIYRPEDEHENDFIGSWITAEQKELEIEGKSQKVMKITVSVPKDASPGDYTGGLAFERKIQEINNPNLTLAFRVIRKINLKVTNDPQPVPMLQTGWVPNPYLLGSSGLFLGSMVYYFAARRKEKRKAKGNGQNGQNNV